MRQYFGTLAFKMKACSGLPGVASMDPAICPNLHYHLYPIKRQFEAFSPSADVCALRQGDFQEYMSHCVSIAPEMVRSSGKACWRSIDGEDTCGGVNHHFQLIVSTPVILPVQISPNSDWNIPATLHLWPELDHPLHDITYSLVARIFAGQGHFTALLLADSGHVLYYDDMQNNGKAIDRSADMNSIGGHDSTLMPSIFTTSHVLYHLNGGTTSQRRIMDHQVAAIGAQYQIEVTGSITDASTPLSVQFSSQMGLELLPVEDWWWRRDRSNVTSMEYVLPRQDNGIASILREEEQDANAKISEVNNDNPLDRTSQSPLARANRIPVHYFSLSPSI